MYSQIAKNKRKTVYIMLLFLLLIAGLGWIASGLYGDTSIFYWVVAGAGIYTLIQYFAASKLALAVNGAKEVTKKEQPELYRVVENLSIATGMPMPKVYVMDDPALNAFATGRDPQHAAVCATTGLIAALDRTELEAVMAHEMGHVQNYDIRVSIIAFGLVSVIGFLADVLSHILWFGGRDERNNSPLFTILGIAAAILAPVVAMLIQLAISRSREYLADSTGALTTRHPDGLISALEKISQHGSKVRVQNTSTSHLFFANPLKGKSLASFFSTHPPIEDRIARLRAMGDKL
jgi:heat shock protein HtpX